jgi:hypothetical protein
MVEALCSIKANPEPRAGGEITIAVSMIRKKDAKIPALKLWRMMFSFP